MAFDDLDQAEQAESSPGADDAPATDGASTPTDDTATDEPTASHTEERDDAATGSGRSSADVRDTDTAASDPAAPAFGFDEAKQRPLYARQEAWDAFEDALAIEVETALRRNDVRDAPKRELHDAALRVLADHADEVAERVLTERGIDQ